MSTYSVKFAVGSVVKIADAETLARYMRPQWKYHHPLDLSMLSFALASARIETVGYYHRGDVLYTLAGLPGTWHEACIDGNSVITP